MWASRIKRGGQRVPRWRGNGKVRVPRRKGFTGSSGFEQMLRPAGGFGPLVAYSLCSFVSPNLWSTRGGGRVCSVWYGFERVAIVCAEIRSPRKKKTRIMRLGRPRTGGLVELWLIGGKTQERFQSNDLTVLLPRVNGTRRGGRGKVDDGIKGVRKIWIGEGMRFRCSGEAQHCEQVPL